MTKPRTVWLLYVYATGKPICAGNRVLYGVYSTQVGAVRMQRALEERMATDGPFEMPIMS